MDAAERLFLRRDFPEVNMSAVADEAARLQELLALRAEA